MAAVRLESDAFADKRYDRLAAILGLADADHARGKMTWLWRQCTIESRYELDDLDVKLVLGPNGPAALIDARLGERTPTGIRIKGTEGKVEWQENFKGGAAAGGKARAATAERGPNGQMLPRSTSPAGPAEQPEERIISQQTPAEPSAPAGPSQHVTSPHAHSHILVLLDLAGESGERSITVEQLNKSFERGWAWSIPPRWHPDYSRLAPFSAAEIKAACLAIKRACEKNGSKPNPGLMVRKLEDGRRAVPQKSEAQEVREREMARPPRKRSTYRAPDESERNPERVSHIRDIAAGLGFDTS